MTPDDYCADKAAPPGSDVYYSVLFLAPERRRATIALEAVRRELEDAVRDASDPAVVQSKLQWWRQELAPGPWRMLRVSFDGALRRGCAASGWCSWGA